VLARLASAAVAALVATAISVGPARAATTTSLSSTSISAAPEPGCEPKGLWATQVNSNGTLAAGTYYYAVSAAGRPSACPPMSVVATANAVVVLQWNPVPGAASYTVYRGPSPAALAPLPVLPSCPSKCVAIDPGTAPGSGAPTIASSSLAAGDHTDLSILQRFDYGGDPSTNADDPTVNNPAVANPPTLDTDLIHLPAGLTVSGQAAGAFCDLIGSAPSLLGSLALHGRQDPDEDTCTPASLVGSVQTRARTPAGEALTPGDVYLGEPTAGASLRLLIALRPLCSFHSPTLSPNSNACNTVYGSNNELDMEFLAVDANVVERAPGVSGIDAQFFDISSGSEQAMPKNLTVRNSGGTPVTVVTLQHRTLVTTLFGWADQATATTADDGAFVTLPTCGSPEVAASVTTYADATPASASVPFTSLDPCPTPPAETPPTEPPPAETPPAETPPAQDRTPPETAIDRVKVKGHAAKVRFSGVDPAARAKRAGALGFQCKLDKGAFKTCASPKKFKHLDEGRHEVRVQAIDAAGNVDASPAKARFKV
jgi:hypothetical protein